MKPAEVIMGFEKGGSSAMLVRSPLGRLEVFIKQRDRKNKSLGSYGPLELLTALNRYHKAVDALKALAA